MAILSSAAFTAVISAVIVQRQGTVERKRRACAEALTDALDWIELAYRIRRRFDDEPAILSWLRDQINALQARLAFHDSWLRVELPLAHASYRELVSAIKSAAQDAIQDAWKAEPIKKAEQMNTAPLFEANFDVEVTSFTNEVRKVLSFWRFWQ